MTSQDIYANDPYAKPALCFLLTILFCAVVCCISTINDSANFELSVRFLCIGVATGLTQAGQRRQHILEPYISYLSLLIQLSLKFLSFRDLKRLFPLVEFIENIYRRNSDINDEYFVICERFGRLTQIGVRLGISGYLTVAVAVVALTAIESIVKGRVQPCMFLYFPFIRHYSLPLLIAQTIFNHVAAFLAFAGMSPGDAFFILVFLNIFMTSEIVQRQLDELDALLEDPLMDPCAVRAKLRDYLVMHLKYIR